jgi:Protein of unknown function (DUF2490)
MQRFTKLALRLGPAFLAVGVIAGSRPCLAQEVEGPGAGRQSTSVTAPATYVGLIAPVTQRIGVRLYGWYIGELKAPGVTAELPIRATKFLTITPGYQFVEMSPSGIDNYVEQPLGLSETYREHQFRLDGTFKFAIRKLEITDRNMYVRRFRPAWVGDDINRYRNRVGLAHPLGVMGQTWKPFASFEAYFDQGQSGTVKNRVWLGVNVPIQKQVVFQPGYIWENNRTPGIRDVNYLLAAFIVSPK